MNRKEGRGKKKRNKKLKRSSTNVLFGHLAVKSFLENLNSPISVYDYRRRKCIYVNRKFTELTGIPPEQCYREPLEKFHSWIHPPDLDVLRGPVAERLMQVCYDFVKSNTARLTYAVNFRLKEKNGLSAHVLAHSTVLEWNEFNLPAVALNILTDLANYKKDQKIIFTVSLFNERTDRWENVVTEEFLRDPEMLSRRQGEIMRLMVKGKTLEMISKLLHISYNTVRTHCQNILNKTGCASQEELKELAVTEGWV